MFGKDFFVNMSHVFTAGFKKRIVIVRSMGVYTYYTGSFLFGYALLSVFFVLLSVWEIRAKTALIYFAELSFLFILIDKTEEAYEQLNL